jgi:outer membrane protein insertion porin family
MRFARLLCCMLICLPGLASAEVVNSIEISGNQRIETSAVETYLEISRGQDISRYDMDMALKKLYDTGFFADVGMDMDGGVLKVNVVENPSINEVIFEGNDQVDTKDLEKEVTLRARSIYTRTKVSNDLKRLLDVYRRGGRYSAEITPQIIELPQNRVNLVYNIVEGPRAFIENITFIGNDSYDSQTLEKIINSSKERWYQFLTDSDRYDPDRLQYDQELLRRFYFENGYADFKVKSAIAELSPQRDAFYLTFTIEEGEKYKFGDVDVKSSLAAGKMPDLKEAITTKKGDTYNATEVEDSIDHMVDKLSDAGFAFVDINPVTKHRDGKEKIIDLTYDIKEGPKVYVERINISGNMRTLDEVVRREFRLTEGDAYSSSKMKRTQQRLNNLNYFEKVDIQNKPGSTPDKTIIDVDVAEKSTGEITFGAGFSTADGPLADVGIKESNFLGRGQELRLRTMFAAKRQMYNVGFTEPYFLDRPVEAAFDLYKTAEDYSTEASYDREATGGILKFTYNLSEKLKHQVRYNLEDSKITNVDASASRYIKDQEGEDVASIIGHSLIFDGRDNRQNPTSGYYWRINEDIAGLGGDDKFLRHELQGEYYYPVAKKWTLLFAGSAGNIIGLGEDVRINQRFYIGSEEIRGFSKAGIGARDVTTDDALGGNNYYAGTAEMRFPLGLPDDLGVSGAAFVDVGSLWGVDDSGPEVRDSAAPRASAGIGVAWSSPFGPIRIDFAKAFLKQDYDDEELIRFSFGTKF